MPRSFWWASLLGCPLSVRSSQWYEVDTEERGRQIDEVLMKPVSRTLFIALIALVGVSIILVSCRWFNRRFTQGMEVAVQHKAVKHSPGKVLSATKLALEESSQGDAQQYRICFSIESSSEIANEERSEYQDALNRPSCRNVQNPAAAKLKVGDVLAIGYLLENEGQISVARIETSGQSIYP